jgi:hypothetical protein
MIISELSKELVHFFHFITPKSSFRRTSYLISSHIQLISSHIRAHFVAYPGHFVAVAHPGHLHFVAYPSSFRRISRSFHRKSERFWDVVRFFCRSFFVRFPVSSFPASLLRRMQHPPSHRHLAKMGSSHQATVKKCHLSLLYFKNQYSSKW